MKKGVTLMEMLVVVLIFTFLFGATLTILALSDRSWQTGQGKLIEQQEARKTMDNIGRLLRQTAPDWVIDSTHYPVAISEQNTRIDFYQPIFDANGAIASLRKITFKINPSDSTQLLKKEGTANPVVVATQIESIDFGGGCAECSAFNCTSVAEDCPLVTVEVKTRKDNVFTLSSQINLRNGNTNLGVGTGIEEPGEGEV